MQSQTETGSFEEVTCDVPQRLPESLHLTSSLRIARHHHHHHNHQPLSPSIQQQQSRLDLIIIANGDDGNVAPRGPLDFSRQLHQVMYRTGADQPSAPLSFREVAPAARLNFSQLWNTCVRYVSAILALVFLVVSSKRSTISRWS